MSEVIVIASGKGGTGKTTVCAGLAAALAKAKYKVLIIDCDSGMRGVDLMLGISDRLVYDISDVISGACEYKDALYKVDGDYELYSVAAPLHADDEVSPSLIKQFVGKVREDFDYILIDSPAGTGSGFYAAAVAADRALVVVNTEPISISYGIGLSEHDTEGRVITAEYDQFYLVVCYTPNAQRELQRLSYRMAWEEAFLEYLKG